MTKVVPEIKLEEFIYKPDTFGTIRAIGIDKYPGEMPIVRELLQNADDAKATLVRFRICDDEMVVENNGRPFTMPHEVDRKEDSDFYRISHIGLGKTEEEMTGIFGIGFTAVFHLTDNPRIISNRWDFQIHVDGLPVIKRVPFDMMTGIHMPLRLYETELSRKIGAEVFDSKKKERFERGLLLEIYQDIFFLKALNKIEVYKNGSKLYSVSKKVKEKETLAVGVTCEHITIQVLSITHRRRKKHIERWQIYSLDGIDIPPDLQGLGQTLKQRVAIAIPRIFKGFRRLQKFDTENYVCYTLPVTPTGFNFKYNASKLFTTSGRGEFVIKEGLKREWNLWQMDNLAQLLTLIIADLISKGVAPDMIYELVPDASQIRNKMDERIFNSFKAKVESKEVRLFYTSQGIWREKGNIYMNWDGLYEVLPEESGRYLIHPKLRRYEHIFESYGIGKMGLDEFVDYLESKYGTAAYESKRSEDPNRIRKIFEYLRRQYIEPIFIERLKRICILLTEDGILRSYNYQVFFPTDEEMPLINPGDIIHHLTYNTKASKKFLKVKLKVKKMNLHHLIIDSFLPRIGGYTPDEKFEFVWYLVKRKREVVRKRNTVEKLKESLNEIILVEKINEQRGPIFFADAELKEIFKDRLNYISPRYEEQAKREHVKWKGFFKKIGVKETPDTSKIVSVVQEIVSTGYKPENVRLVELLIEFLCAHWRKFYSKHVEELKKLRGYAWIPTTKHKLALPTEIYIDRNLSKLIGESQNFLAIRKPKSKGVVRVLGLLAEARLHDVINTILEKRGEEKGEKDEPVDFKVYSFLNNKADSLDDDLLKALTNNRTIWFQGRLWKPSKLFRENHQNEFGPNGWLRGYLQKDRLSKLTRLCSVLGINRLIKTPDDYIDWLLDISDEPEQATLTYWKNKLIHNAYSKLAQIVNAIPEVQLEKLRNRKIMLSSEHGLRFPRECYLIRKAEEIIYERVVRAGILVPIVKAESMDLERLYSRLGVKEIIYSLSSKREYNGETFFDEDSTKRFQQIVQWLDGYEYSLTGSVSEHNLAFRRLKVYRVSKLKVIYSLQGEGYVLVGKPIEDICCLERADDNDILYLDTDFQFKSDDHLRLLSLQLIKNLNPAIDRISWGLAIPSLLILGQIIGISPYDRELREQRQVTEWTLPRLEVVLEARMPKKEVETPKGIEVPVAISDERTFKPAEDLVKEAFKEKEPSKDLEEVIYKPAVDITGPIVSSSLATVKEDIEYKAGLNLQPMQVDGELIHVTPGIPIPSKEERDKLKALLRRIVEVMGGNPDTVRIITAEETTNARLERNQILCNASLSDVTPIFWIIVIARELAHHYSRKRYAHIKAMSRLIEKAIEQLHEIYPDLYERMNPLK